MCATITTTRKFFTILLSVLIHPENKLAAIQWAAVALVFSGLGGEIHQKWEKSRQRERERVAADGGTAYSKVASQEDIEASLPATIGRESPGSDSVRGRRSVEMSSVSGTASNSGASEGEEETTAAVTGVSPKFV